jgi:uncharacterized protein
MAGSSLFALLDDIATILDDVAVMTKVAAKKTAGVLGDDLALNAEQVSGVRAERELPVVWAVAKGSAVNKLILVPAALVISAFAPWAVTPLLMLGGAFLCYEGCEKLAHKLLHSAAEDQAHHAEHVGAVANPAIDLVAFEKTKIRGAIRTDFVLSAEIIVITLGTVASAPFGKQVAVLSTIAILMTVGVYGLVAGIVKLDDAGLRLTSDTGRSAWAESKQSIGRFFLWGAPYLMKGLSIAGTAAMFLVGGGILVHGLPMLHHAVAQWASQWDTGFAVLAGVLAPLVADAFVGIVAGAIILFVMTILTRRTEKRT